MNTTEYFDAEGCFQRNILRCDTDRVNDDCSLEPAYTANS